MMRYCVLFSMFVAFCAVGCKNPYGRTRIPPPPTSGVVTSPAAPYYNPAPAGQPQLSQPPLGQPQFRPQYTQPPASANGLVPIPGPTSRPTYPGNPPAPRYPQGAPVYPQNPGAGILPHRTNSIAIAPPPVAPTPVAPTNLALGRVQPVGHEPRLRPVPSFGEVDPVVSINPVVLIDENDEGEPVIRIEESAGVSDAPNDDDLEGGKVGDADSTGSVFEEKSKTPTFRKPSRNYSAPALIAAASHTSVLVRSNEPETPISVPRETTDTRASGSLFGSSADSGRVDVADLPKARAKPQPKFRAMTSTPPARYGHADDYGWLKGKLEYSAARKQWKLRYIPIDGNAGADEYGGSVVLDSVDDQEYSAGDFVAVRGAVGDRDPEAQDFSTTYHVQQMKSM